MISIQDFMELDLRTARVNAAERVEKTDKLMKLTVQVGDEERTIVAGIAKVYSLDQLVGKKIIIVANLEPATIRGVESNGMLLAASIDGDPYVATFDRWVPSGVQVR